MFGMAVFDLISLLRSKKYYWESLLWGVLMFFSLLSIVYRLFDDLILLTSNLGYYTLFIFSPLFFVQASYSLTPKNENDNMNDLFHSNRKAFFGSVSGVLLINFIIQYFITHRVEPIQHVLLVLLIASNMFFNKLYLRIVASGMVCFSILLDYWELAL